MTLLSTKNINYGLIADDRQLQWVI